LVAVTGCVFPQVKGKEDGRWIARYTINGKRQQVYGVSKEDAFLKRQKKLDELNGKHDAVNDTPDLKNGVLSDKHKNSKVIPPEVIGLMLSEWLEEWLEIHVRPGKALSTYSGYKNFVIGHIIPAIGSIRLKDLTPEIIQMFINSKVNDGNKSSGDKKMSLQSMKNMQIMMNAALNSAVESKHISNNPMKQLFLPNVARKEKRVLSLEDEKNLTNACCASDKIILYGVVIALRLGLNIGELLSLKWSDIDLIEKRVFIRHLLRRMEGADAVSMKKTALSVTETGTVRELREQDIPYGFFHDMEKYHRKCTALFGYSPDTVIANGSGTPIDPGYYTRLFKKMLNKTDIENAGFNILKNTFTVRLFEKGYNIGDMQRLLGFKESSRPIRVLKNISSDNLAASV